MDWKAAAILGICGFASILSVGLMICYFIRMNLFVNKYKNLVELQEFYCGVAYEFIYKDQILSFSSSGFKVNGDELETIKRNFVKLTMDFMGSNIVDILVSYYGNEESLIQNLLIWFSRKLDTDEIMDFVEKQQTTLEEQNSQIDENVMGKPTTGS